MSQHCHGVLLLLLLLMSLSTVHCPLSTLHCPLSTVHCPLYTVHCTLYTVHCTLHTAHCTLHTAHCTLYTVHCTLYTVHCTLYIVHCTLYIVHCTLYIVHCTLSCVKESAICRTLEPDGLRACGTFDIRSGWNLSDEIGQRKCWQMVNDKTLLVVSASLEVCSAVQLQRLYAKVLSQVP